MVMKNEVGFHCLYTHMILPVTLTLTRSSVAIGEIGLDDHGFASAWVDVRVQTSSAEVIDADHLVRHVVDLGQQGTQAHGLIRIVRVLDREKGRRNARCLHAQSVPRGGRGRVWDERIITMQIRTPSISGDNSKQSLNSVTRPLSFPLTRPSPSARIQRNLGRRVVIYASAPSDCSDPYLVAYAYISSSGSPEARSIG